MKRGIEIKSDYYTVKFKIISTSAHAETESVKKGSRYIDVETAASVIGISKSKLYYLVSKRRINHFRKRHRIFFLKQDLSANITY